MPNADKITMSAPEAVALAIVLIFFMALWCLIGYTAWRAMQQRSRARKLPNDADDSGDN